MITKPHNLLLKIKEKKSTSGVATSILKGQLRRKTRRRESFFSIISEHAFEGVVIMCEMWDWNEGVQIQRKFAN